MIWSGTTCGFGTFQTSQPENTSPLLQIRGAWEKVFWKIIDFVFPIYCVGCNGVGTHCCNDCAIKIPRNATPEDQMNERHTNPPTGIELLFAASPFKEKSILSTVLHRFKYDGAKEIAPYLCDLFLDSMILALCQIPHKIFVPVPLHWRREWNRGFNQSRLLANELQKRTGGDVADLLERTRYTEPQAMLTKDERQKNIRGAFKISALPNKEDSFILVDDVYTTGFTMNECAQILRSAGAKNIHGVVVGRA